MASPPNDINFLFDDKKRKLEPSFKIPKKKRPADEVSVVEPTPLSPPRAELPAKIPKKERSSERSTDRSSKTERTTDRERTSERSSERTSERSSERSLVKKKVIVDCEKGEKPVEELKRVVLLETPPLPGRALLDTPTSPPLKPYMSPPMKPAELESVFAEPMVEEVVEPVVQSIEIEPPVVIQEYVTLVDGTKHPLSRGIWHTIFSSLGQGDLGRCMGVCKVWHEWCSDSQLWEKVNLSRYGPIFPDTLRCVIKRQPKELDLSYCTISRKQLDWLLPRCTELETIRLSGLPISIIGALNAIMVPDLKHIDVRWVDDFSDWALRDLLCITREKGEQRSRYPNLRGLQLSGCPVSEDSVKHCITYCPTVEYLDLSYNSNISDRVVETICGSPLIYSIKKIDISGCYNVTDKSLIQFKKCYDLNWIDCRSCKDITKGACVRYIAASKRDLLLTEEKLIHPHSVQIYSTS